MNLLLKCIFCIAYVGPGCDPSRAHVFRVLISNFVFRYRSIFVCTSLSQHKVTVYLLHTASCLQLIYYLPPSTRSFFWKLILARLLKRTLFVEPAGPLTRLEEPPNFANLSHIIRFTPLYPVPLRFILILFVRLGLHCPTWVFLSGCLTQILSFFFVHTCYMSHPSHPL